MLKNKKYVTKIKNIIIGLMAIIVIFGFYIGVRNIQDEVIEIKSIPAEKLENMKTALEIDKRKN